MSIEPTNGETRIVRLVEYLEESLIPDLEKSGLNETARDFRMAVDAIRELQEMVRKLREV